MAKANGARRVVVTGTGVVTPIGLTVDEFWASMKASKCGVTELGGFPLEDLNDLRSDFVHVTLPPPLEQSRRPVLLRSYQVQGQ